MLRRPSHPVHTCSPRKCSLSLSPFPCMYNTCKSLRNILWLIADFLLQTLTVRDLDTRRCSIKTFKMLRRITTSDFAKKEEESKRMRQLQGIGINKKKNNKIQMKHYVAQRVTVKVLNHFIIIFFHSAQPQIEQNFLSSLVAITTMDCEHIFFSPVSITWISQNGLEIRAIQLRFDELWRVQRRRTMTCSIWNSHACLCGDVRR